MGNGEIDAAFARDLLTGAEPPLLVDVREASEWESGYLTNAVHVPLGELQERIGEIAPDRSRPVVLYCAVGARSLFAAHGLRKLGYADAVSVAGGIEAWRQAGFPVEAP